MTSSTPRLVVDSELRVAYLSLTEIPAGAAAYTRSAGPKDDADSVLLDYDAEGHLLGVEFLSLARIPDSLLAQAVTQAPEDPQESREEAQDEYDSSPGLQDLLTRAAASPTRPRQR